MKERKPTNVKVSVDDGVIKLDENGMMITSSVRRLNDMSPVVAYYIGDWQFMTALAVVPGEPFKMINDTKLVIAPEIAYALAYSGFLPRNTTVTNHYARDLALAKYLENKLVRNIPILELDEFKLVRIEEGTEIHASFPDCNGSSVWRVPNVFGNEQVLHAALFNSTCLQYVSGLRSKELLLKRLCQSDCVRLAHRYPDLSKYIVSIEQNLYGLMVRDDEGKFYGACKLPHGTLGRDIESIAKRILGYPGYEGSPDDVVRWLTFTGNSANAIAFEDGKLIIDVNGFKDSDEYYRMECEVPPGFIKDVKIYYNPLGADYEVKLIDAIPQLLMYGMRAVNPELCQEGRLVLADSIKIALLIAYNEMTDSHPRWQLASDLDTLIEVYLDNDGRLYVNITGMEPILLQSGKFVIDVLKSVKILTD